MICMLNETPLPFLLKKKSDTNMVRRSRRPLNVPFASWRFHGSDILSYSRRKKSRCHDITMSRHHDVTKSRQLCVKIRKIINFYNFLLTNLKIHGIFIWRLYRNSTFSELCRKGVASIWMLRQSTVR